MGITMKTKRIGILGGTFNPIHHGHLILAETARTQLGLDKILFVPSGVSYMKEKEAIPSGEIRAAMTELAIADNPYFSLSKIEIERAGNSYTYETLEKLNAQNPGTEYFFITGADILFWIEQWKYPERIFAACTVAAALRQGKSTEEMLKKCRKLQEKYQARIEMLSSSNIEISSTVIRRKIQREESVRYLVPEKVLEYIEHNKVYVS